MLVVQHHGTNTPISYKHVINPLGNERDGFSPNWEQYKKINETSKFNIRKSDFEKAQCEGAIIIVNRAGGWCTITYGMDILEGAELVNKDLIGK